MGFTSSAAVGSRSATTLGSGSGTVRWPFFTIIQAKNWVSHRLPRSARVPPQPRVQVPGACDEPPFTVIQAKNWVSHRQPRSLRVPPRPQVLVPGPCDGSFFTVIQAKNWVSHRLPWLDSWLAVRLVFRPDLGFRFRELPAVRPVRASRSSASLRILGFRTHRLTRMSDYLVRVSRRVRWGARRPL